jgi:hypothetical protein
MAETLNQIAAQVAHSVDLQRLANSIARGENAEYDKLAKFIRELLLEYDTINSKKLRDELIKQITAEVAETADNVTASMLSQIDDVIRQEVNFQWVVLRNISSKKPIKPKLDAVSRAILNQPLVLNGKGLTWEERIGAFKSNQVQAAKQIIMAGWSNGQTTNEISRQLIGTRTTRGVIDQSKTAANALVKDLITHIASMTRAEVARQNSDIVRGEKTIVTLDSRTSQICQNYGSQDNGGKEWIYAEDGRNFPRPPFHYRCRSINIMLVNEEYDLEIETTRPAVVDGKAIQVDSKTDWLTLAKRYPSLAEQALGKTRAKIIENMSASEFKRVAFNSLNEYNTIDEMVANSKRVASLLKE